MRQTDRSRSHKSAIVVGAGISGACCAAYLQQRDIEVTVIDVKGIAEETSFGNAGVLNPAGVAPVAMPGMIKQLPKWLLDPKGPLTIRWLYLPWALGWLTRFLACATHAQMERSAAALKLLAGSMFESYRGLLPPGKYRELISHVGSLYVYESGAERVNDKTSVELRRRFGAVLEEVDARGIRELEPGLSHRFKYGFFAPRSAITVDPQRLTRTIMEEAEGGGVRFVKAEVHSVTRRPDGRKVARTSGGEFAADAIVIAAGAWSNRFSAQLGEPVPLESQRGYHVTLANPGVVANRMVSWDRRKIIATPMNMGLRFAGTVEIAGLKAAPNWDRADALLETARLMYPAMNDKEPSRWMGHRPCLPDSVPVIGESRKARGVFYAFGHGHAGMIGSATTGRVISQIVAGERPDFDLWPFRPDRF